MARKNPFANLMDESQPKERAVALDYTIKGASRSILSSIDELAERADKLLEGETVVELDPDVIEGSFVRDRIEEDPQEFEDLVSAIGERGQDSPILVRPHPGKSGHYMIVFGHRRVQAARRLGRKVRAVIKDLADRDHVVAQGQENSARSNLSFIEKAVFASRLSQLNYDNDNTTVMAALSVDKATLSKMLSVAALPPDILEAIGGARSIGRDRWYEFRQLLDRPAHLEKLRTALPDLDLDGKTADERFQILFDTITKKKSRPAAKAPKKARWTPTDKAVTADIRNDGKNYTLALKARDAVGFGEYIAANLDTLYRDFRAGTKSTEGD